MQALPDTTLPEKRDRAFILFMLSTGCRRINEAVEERPDAVRKAMIQQLVADIDSREAILPTFRLPHVSVREPYGMVEPRGFEPLTF